MLQILILQFLLHAIEVLRALHIYWVIDGSATRLTAAEEQHGCRSAFSCIVPSMFYDMILEGCTQRIFQSMRYKILHENFVLNPFLDTDSSSFCYKLLEGPKFYILSSVMTCYVDMFLYTKSRTQLFLWFSLSNIACFGEWNTCSWQCCIFLSCYCFIK